MEEVELTLNSEYFAMTEIPSETLDEMEAAMETMTIDIEVDGKKQALRYTLDRKQPVTVLNMQRVH